MTLSQLHFDVVAAFNETLRKSRTRNTEAVSQAVAMTRTCQRFEITSHQLHQIRGEHYEYLKAMSIDDGQEPGGQIRKKTKPRRKAPRPQE